jgi:hypothetical protein
MHNLLQKTANHWTHNAGAGKWPSDNCRCDFAYLVQLPSTAVLLWTRPFRRNGAATSPSRLRCVRYKQWLAGAEPLLCDER